MAKSKKLRNSSIIIGSAAILGAYLLLMNEETSLIAKQKARPLRAVESPVNLSNRESMRRPAQQAQAETEELKSRLEEIISIADTEAIQAGLKVALTKFQLPLPPMTPENLALHEKMLRKFNEDPLISGQNILAVLESLGRSNDSTNAILLGIIGHLNLPSHTKVSLFKSYATMSEFEFQVDEDGDALLQDNSMSLLIAVDYLLTHSSERDVLSNWQELTKGKTIEFKAAVKERFSVYFPKGSEDLLDQ